MEDPSVDVTFLCRKDILARLDLKSSHHDTGRLKVILRNVLKKNHPIHKYLSQLSHENLNQLYLNIFEKHGNRKYEQMRKSLANEMFLKFQKAPLTTLIWILRNRKIPTDISFDTIKDLPEHIVDNSVCKETDDSTITKNFDDCSNHEVSPAGEMTSSNKKK